MLSAIPSILKDDVSDRENKEEKRSEEDVGGVGARSGKE